MVCLRSSLYATTKSCYFAKGELVYFVNHKTYMMHTMYKGLHKQYNQNIIDDVMHAGKQINHADNENNFG